ncbi:MAG: LptF/LptG family permease [Candidatus Zixiibacteriota bacterium]
MNLLSRYILKEHIAPFSFAFFIITFVLILETLPRLVDMVVGKSVSMLVVLELMVLNLAWMLALSVPMATLVATLTAFGRMTADFEIRAIRASGVNLARVLLPLLAAALTMTFLMVQFNDRILPGINHKARVLMGDIRSMRPTLIFRPGLFVDDIRGYLILLDRVNHATSEVAGVRINDIRNPESPVMIIADHGLMEFVDRGNTIKFTLYDGEIHEMNMVDREDYRRITFGKQVFHVTDIGSELQRTETTHKTDREMNIDEMEVYVATLKKSAQPYQKRARKLVATEIHRLLSTIQADSAGADSATVATLDDSTALLALAADIRAIDRQLDRSVLQIREQQKLVNKYEIEIYKKFSIPFACVAFMLFGAPLGILTRRGGAGYSISISLGLFVVYWAFLIGGESLADRGVADPFWAMWGANILISVVGGYLFYMVHTEKQLFTFLRRD